MSHATCLLALPEFEVVDVWEFADETIVHIIRPRDETACTRFGMIARHRVHDRVVHRVRDLPAAGRAVVLLWRKRGVGVRRGVRDLVEDFPPNSTTGAHFHDVDQFQVFFGSPSAWYQRSELRNTLVHYSDAYTT